MDHFSSTKAKLGAGGNSYNLILKAAKQAPYFEFGVCCIKILQTHAKLQCFQLQSWFHPHLLDHLFLYNQSHPFCYFIKLYHIISQFNFIIKL